MSQSERAEREFLEGLRYEDKFPVCPSCERGIDGEGYEAWDGVLVCGDCMAQINEDHDQARWENTIGREDIFG